MPVLSFIYQQWLDTYGSKSFLKKSYSFFFKSSRNLILRFGDPACQMPIGDQLVWMPYSHMLPYYNHVDPQYDTLLRRLADYLRASQGQVRGIDIGANIGDTILACALANTDRFLAIEPNPVYFAYLERNLGTRSNVQRLQYICGNKDAISGFQTIAGRGTAQIREASGGDQGVAALRLDTLLQSQLDFRDCNFLKIDTDGHDFDVIRGAKELIGRARPAVLFECDLFENPRWPEDIMEMFQLFASAGYRHALIYDNAGYLVGRLDPQQPAAFAFPLLHKLAVQKYYFDVLMLPEDREFVVRELDHFAALAPAGAGQTAAQKIVESIQKNFIPA